MRILLMRRSRRRPILGHSMTVPQVTEIRLALEPVVADPFVSDLARAALRSATREPAPTRGDQADRRLLRSHFERV